MKKEKVDGTLLVNMMVVFEFSPKVLLLAVKVMFSGVLSVHGESRNTHKEDEVEEEQEVLGRCHAAFSHDATPGDTQMR